MNFLIWYGIGVVTIAFVLFHDSYLDNNSIKVALRELKEVLITKADIASTIILALVALPGPLLPFIFAYFVIRNWYEALPIGGDDKRIYPWDDD